MRLPLLQDVRDLIRWANEVVRTLEINISNVQQTKTSVGDIVKLPIFTVATVPSADPAARVIYVSNETGGAVLAFSDGTNWRRVTDRNVVS